MELEHNKLFGSLRTLLNKPVWQETEHRQLLTLLRVLIMNAPAIYRSRWQPYLIGQKQRWQTTTLMAYNMDHVDILHRTVPWANWCYQPARTHTTTLTSRLNQLLDHKHHQKLVGLDCTALRFERWRGAKTTIGMLQKHRIMWQLKSLNMAGCQLDRRQLHQLIVPIWPNIQTLDLSGNRLTYDKLLGLFHQDFQHIKTLKLNDNNLNIRAAELLATTMSLYNLERLELKNNKISGKGKRRLAQSLIFPSTIKIIH